MHLNFFGWSSTGDHSKMFLLFEFFYGTPPSCLKVEGCVVDGGWPTAFTCHPHSPLVLDLIGTWLGLGLGGFGTKGLGTGLDNKLIFIFY